MPILRAKYKIERKYAADIWGREKSSFKRRKTTPGVHANKKRKTSTYGLQLAAKQKLRFHYNIKEKQLRKAYLQSVKIKGDTSANLVNLLERRLDAAVYRLKFAPTIFAARQMVSHGHIRVNNNKINIPSYLLKNQEEVSLKDKSSSLSLLIQAANEKGREVPIYLEGGGRTMKGFFITSPDISTVPYSTTMDLNMIIEWYSRRA